MKRSHKPLILTIPLLTGGLAKAAGLARRKQQSRPG